MDSIDDIAEQRPAEAAEESALGVQPGAWFLELSLDWIVLRASENVHHLLGESHVALIDEPLGRFVHAQALHDLRNLFSRLSGTTGVANAYRVRLTDDHDLFDIAFQLSNGRVLLEAVPSVYEGFGKAYGSIGGLIAGLSDSGGQALLDGGARRMRALTGYDRVSLTVGDRKAASSRGLSAGEPAFPDRLPAIIADCSKAPVAVFPRRSEDTSIGAALMRAPDAQDLEQFRSTGVRSVLRVPFTLDDGQAGEFCCDSRSPHRPNLELHAAAQLFAQLFAMRLEIDQLKTQPFS